MTYTNNANTHKYKHIQIKAVSGGATRKKKDRNVTWHGWGFCCQQHKHVNQKNWESLWRDLSVWPLSSSVSSSTTVDWFLTDVKAIFMNSPVDLMTFFQLFFNIQTIEDLVEITLIWICSVWICHTLLSCPICFCFTLQWCRNAVVTSRVWLFKFYKKISRQNSLF